MAESMVCIEDFEKYAFKNLPLNALDYYRCGANQQITLGENIKAFSRWKLRPRMLNDVSEIDTSTTILGNKISFPVCVAPTAMHKMAHPEGEVATARGAYEIDTAFTLSTIATSSIEDVALSVPNVLRFFQLYIYKQRDVTLQLIKRAENNNYKAILLTVDTPFFGKRIANNRNKFKLPSHLKMANFEALDVKGSGVNQSKTQSGLNEYANSLFDKSITWSDVKWLKSVTKLPIIIKGVLTADDALKALECDVNGILVSNHGARQLDTVLPTIDALPEIVSAVNGRCEVYLDGGVRQGTDVLKALALGAKAVFIGRPAVYGLAFNGSEGVKSVLNILKQEFRDAMGLSGCSSIGNIKRNLVIHEHSYAAKL